MQIDYDRLLVSAKVKPLYDLESLSEVLLISDRSVRSLLDDPDCPLRYTHQVLGKQTKRVSHANLLSFIESIRIAPDLAADASPKRKGGAA